MDLSYCEFQKIQIKIEFTDIIPRCTPNNRFIFHRIELSALHLVWKEKCRRHNAYWDKNKSRCRFSFLKPKFHMVGWNIFLCIQTKVCLHFMRAVYKYRILLREITRTIFFFFSNNRNSFGLNLDEIFCFLNKNTQKISFKTSR